MVLVSAPIALFSEEEAETAAFGLLLILGGWIVGTIGIIQRSSAKRNFEKSILIYNSQNREFGQTDHNIDLNIKSNGAGLTHSL